MKICKNIKNGKILIYDFAFLTEIQMISSASFGRKCECILRCRGELKTSDWKWLEMMEKLTATSPLTSPLGEEESLFHMPSRSLLSIFAKCCFILREYNLLHPLLFRIIHNRIEIFFFRRRGLRDTTSVPLHLIDLRNVVSEKNIFKDGSSVCVCCCSCCCRS